MLMTIALNGQHLQISKPWLHLNHEDEVISESKDDNDVVQEALARHDNNPRTRARDDMDMERLLKVFVSMIVDTP